MFISCLSSTNHVTSAMAVSVIGELNRRTRRKPPTCRKSL